MNRSSYLLSLFSSFFLGSGLTIFMMSSYFVNNNLVCFNNEVIPILEEHNITVM